ncbi:hypothetical protein V2J09_001817 [Rumex salicifolius]
MAFWGIEVTPKQSHTFRYADVMGKLVLTQATLGAGSNAKKSILQCEVGDKMPVYLCTLLPDKMESCSMNLEFEEEEDVKFSVVGQTSIHLSGFIQSSPESGSEDEFYGEDIVETDSGESSDYSDDSESEDKNFINDGDVDMFPPSSLRNSGVVIEEIVDDEKPATENGNKKHPVKKNQRSKHQLALQGSADAAVLDSEDEDGFPISSSREKGPKTAVEDRDQKAEEGKKKNKKKSETKDDGHQAKSLKRKINETTAGEEPQSMVQQEKSLNPSDATEESQKKKKKKKDKSGTENKTAIVSEDKEQPKESNSGVEDESGEKKKQKKKKKKGKEQVSVEGESDIAVQNISASENAPIKSKAKPGNVRNYPNGLIVEEVEMGKPDGKRASAGKKVLVRYIGKLQKSGKIFDSNIGKAPFKFILGVGQVIKGWDVGVEGMRVGDKRKLTIPPSMGYGAKGAGPIPSNAWLEFNVELVNVL